MRSQILKTLYSSHLWIAKCRASSVGNHSFGLECHHRLGRNRKMQQLNSKQRQPWLSLRHQPDHGPVCLLTCLNTEEGTIPFVLITIQYSWRSLSAHLFHLSDSVLIRLDFCVKTWWKLKGVYYHERASKVCLEKIHKFLNIQKNYTLFCLKCNTVLVEVYKITVLDQFIYIFAVYTVLSVITHY